MSLAVSGTAITFPDASTQTTSPFPGGFAFRNRIINGAMMIDQRNAGASVTPANGQYLVDRWYAGLTQASKFTAQQNAGSVTPPAGFVNYLGATSSSAYSVGSGDAFFFQQAIEGLNVADFGWGAAGAQSITVSFWVRSSLTGTFGGSAMNSAVNRAYPFTFTINSANTWEQKTVTIAGDTSGTWLTTNGIGLRLTFSLGMGSTLATTAGSWAAGNYLSATGATSVVGTNGATFYITGVQLEKNTVATPFDYRPYGTEFQLCQRYCPVYYAEQGTFCAMGTATTNASGVGPLTAQPRVVPTGITVSGSWYTNTSAAQNAATPTFVSYGGGFYVNFAIGAASLSANSAVLINGAAGAKIVFNGCEL